MPLHSCKFGTPNLRNQLCFAFVMNEYAFAFSFILKGENNCLPFADCLFLDSLPDDLMVGSETDKRNKTSILRVNE